MQANARGLRHGTCIVEPPAAAVAAATAAAAASALAQACVSQPVPAVAAPPLAGLALLAVTPQDLGRGPEGAAGGTRQRELQRAVPLQLTQAPRQVGLGAVH